MLGWAEMPLKNRMNKSRHARNALSFVCKGDKCLGSGAQGVPWAGGCCGMSTLHLALNPVAQVLPQLRAIQISAEHSPA